jgi:hypothetical protein
MVSHSVIHSDIEVHKLNRLRTGCTPTYPAHAAGASVTDNRSSTYVTASHAVERGRRLVELHSQHLFSAGPGTEPRLDYGVLQQRLSMGRAFSCSGNGHSTRAVVFEWSYGIWTRINDELVNQLSTFLISGCRQDVFAKWSILCCAASSLLRTVEAVVPSIG